ncbi:hypothetical protein K443DRAFT_162764 [Laccaria amethystina LaAM-08-1]|uniref:Uncharacterized protein n=1 Tax=Laccaria amethystina LaAM-08-1 TaxID=1095629 RepID=A0A0C9WP34_9AGAR|nr:hypothetical protein K443DRAFT_162764 [Laccaria amethystina LaAM-08-1]
MIDPCLGGGSNVPRQHYHAGKTLGRIVVTEIKFLCCGRGLPFNILTHRTVPPQQPQQRRRLLNPLPIFAGTGLGSNVRSHTYTKAPYSSSFGKRSEVSTGTNDVIFVGAISRQYRFLFILPYHRFPLPRYVNVPTTLQNSPSPPVPTPHLEQPQITPHTAFPTVSFPRLIWSTKPSAPPRPTCFGPLAELMT